MFDNATKKSRAEWRASTDDSGFTGDPPGPHLPTGILRLASSSLLLFVVSLLPGYRFKMPVASLALSGVVTASGLVGGW